MIAFLIVSSVVLYVVGIGVAWKPFGDFAESNIRYHSDQQMVRFCLSVIWLLVLPIAIGRWLTNRFHTDARRDRKQNKIDYQRSLELEAAKHEAALATQKRIAAEELQAELRVLGKEDA